MSETAGRQARIGQIMRDHNISYKEADRVEAASARIDAALSERASERTQCPACGLETLQLIRRTFCCTDPGCDYEHTLTVPR